MTFRALVQSLPDSSPRSKAGPNSRPSYPVIPNGAGKLGADQHSMSCRQSYYDDGLMCRWND
jgi:hypothetical protein